MANAEAIAAHLTSKHLPPTGQWIESFMPSVKSTTPVQATYKTALFRMQAADLTQAVQASAANTFPRNISDPDVRETRLRESVVVQLQDVEDIGRSRWSQVEAIEAQERGETTKGREVIRVVPEENMASTTDESPGTHAGAPARSKGPHKLLLQDANGSRVYGVELNPCNIGLDSPMGLKMLLKDVTVARGVLLLEPQNVQILGGKVDSWDKKWKEERKKSLRERVGMKENDD